MTSTSPVSLLLQHAHAYLEHLKDTFTVTSTFSKISTWNNHRNAFVIFGKDKERKFFRLLVVSVPPNHD